MRQSLLLGLALLLSGSAAVEDDFFDDDAEVVAEPAPAAVQAQPQQPQQQPKHTPKATRPAAFDPEFDHSEMAGAAAKKEPPPARKAASSIPAELSRTPPVKPEAAAARPRPSVPILGFFEIAALSFIALYGVVYLWGKQANERIATLWGESFYDLLETQFSQVGEEGAILTKESADTFTIDATGRERCDWLQAKLKLCGRQDLYQVLQGIASPKTDTLIIDVAMSEEDATAYVLAVLDKKLDRTHVQEMSDLKTLTSQCTAFDVPLPPSLRALSEHREVAELLLGGEVSAMLHAQAAHLEQIHYTDYVPAAWGLPSGTKRALHLVMKLPSGGGASKVEASKPLLRLALLLTDRIGKLRLPPAIKEKLKKGRASVEALKFKEGYKQRQEMAQQRKAEKMAAKKNKEPLADREAQRKREEKEARQAAKKRGPGMKIKRV